MSRAIAPTNQWYEPNARGIVTRTARLYPTVVGSFTDVLGAPVDFWGFTDDPDLAEGTLVTVAGSDQVTIEKQVDPDARIAERNGWLIVTVVPVGTGLP